MKNNTKKIWQFALVLAGNTPAIMLPVLLAPQNATVVQAAQTVDVTGTVVEVRAGRGFTFQPDGRGGTYSVASNNLPAGLTRGDKVRVRGTLNGTQVSATDIRVTANATTPDKTTNSNALDVTGTVEAVRGLDGFTFRPNGRNEIYTVRSNNLPRDLSAGDTVRVRGTLRGNQLTANDVRIVTNGNVGNSQATNLDVAGTVVTVRNDGFTFRPDGRKDDYTVRTNNVPRDLRQGDRVRVRGDLRGREVTNVQLGDAYTQTGRDENKRGVGNGEAVEFDAQINAVKGRRQVQAHLPSGTRYDIHSDRDLNLREGDYIRVRGNARRGGFYAIDANSVTQSSAGEYRNQGVEIRTGLNRNNNNGNNGGYNNNGGNNGGYNNPNQNTIRLQGRIERLRDDRFTLLVEDLNDGYYGGNNGGNYGDYPDYGNDNRRDRTDQRGTNDRRGDRNNNNNSDDTQRYNGRRFEVRFDTRDARLRDGDRVTVVGNLNNNIITANRVRLVTNR